MKKILITGANSYIGTSFENYMRKFSNDYEIDTLDMLDPKWRETSFSSYDVVFHVAGIAHQKETKSNAHLYYKINRDLAIEVAKKAKNDSVGQFVFLSSMSVYGKNTGAINKKTIPTPKTNYGKSKLEAENALLAMNDEKFKICILRPPMVYGKNCKGNFQSIIKLVKKTPVFPKVKNERSMIYIDNLSAFIEVVIRNDLEGVHCPQDTQYMQTQVMAKEIANSLDKKIYFSRLLGIAICIVRPFFGILKKAFGNLVYSDFDDANSYCNMINQKEALKNSLDIH